MSGHRSSRPSAAVSYICLWLILCMAVVFIKRWIFVDRDFKYPAFVVTCHLLFNTLCTQAVAFSTKVLAPREVTALDWKKTFAQVFPLAVFTTCSLTLANTAYIQLNIAAIHVLKALTPVLVCILLFAAGLASVTWVKCLDIVIISGGIILASSGWGQPAFMGIAMQVMSTSTDAVRLVLAQRALESPQSSMEPIALQYQFAPVACMVSIVSTFMMTSPTPDEIWANWHFLLANSALCFVFDLAGFSVVKETSSLTLSICGILTDLIMIGISVFLWNDSFGFLQSVGCVLAAAGITHHLYYVRRENEARDARS